MNRTDFFEEIQHDSDEVCRRLNVSNVTYILPHRPPCNIQDNMIRANPEWLRQMRELCNQRDADDERGLVIGVNRIRYVRGLVEECCGRALDKWEIVSIVLAACFGALVLAIVVTLLPCAWWGTLYKGEQKV
jgi:hypothetical protein